MLARTMKWLSRPIRARGPCYLLISPDPRETTGYTVFTESAPHYSLRLGSGEVTDVADYVPSFMIARNKGSTSVSHFSQRDHPEYTDWARIYNTGRKNAEGKSIVDVLTDIVTRFPKYDLQTEEGIGKAAAEMEALLSSVGEHIEI